jgi:hypothetical protein
MGVLFNYFHAADVAAVAAVMDADGDVEVFDGLDLNGIDPPVILGTLVAAIKDVPWSVDVLGDRPVWPDPGPDGPDADYDPLSTGPMVLKLSADARDALAGLPDDRLPDLAAQWAESEELAGVDPADLRPVIDLLRQLARRAKAADELLYCWICL